MEKTKAANFPSPTVIPNPKARLLDQVRAVVPIKNYSKDVSTTQIYSHAMQKRGLGARSPLDRQMEVWNAECGDGRGLR
jgi:hypothetical protein